MHKHTKKKKKVKGRKAREQQGEADKVGHQINVKVAESRHRGRLWLPSRLPAMRMAPAMRRATRCKGQANAGGGRVRVFLRGVVFFKLRINQTQKVSPGENCS